MLSFYHSAGLFSSEKIYYLRNKNNQSYNRRKYRRYKHCACCRVLCLLCKRPLLFRDQIDCALDRSIYKLEADHKSEQDQADDPLIQGNAQNDSANYYESRHCEVDPYISLIPDAFPDSLKRITEALIDRLMPARLFSDMAAHRFSIMAAS